MPPGTRYFLEVNPRIPKRLARLQELAHNLWYSWDRPTRALFAKLNPPLWDAVGHSPKALLKRIDEQRLIDAATDPAFLDSLTRVLAAFDAYHAEPPFRQNSGAVQREDLVAYFCAEFGIHESLPIYSGGLGILAGDHCKAASDFQLPFVAVGLMYRQGYFTQTIDGDGRRRAAYYDSDFEALPIEAVKRKDGTELSVELAFPARKLLVKVWQAGGGHALLFLLRPPPPEHAERERDIVHRLYGGDRTTRLEQEIVLGVGGMRALAALGFEPTVWHINEGHAAFLVLERVRALVAGGLALEAAIEAVASNTVFTTHTPVPAGHDQFTDATVVPYVKSLFGELGAPDKVAALARPPSGGDFNMTALATRGTTTACRAFTAACRRTCSRTSGRRSRRKKTRWATSRTRCTCPRSSRRNGAKCSTGSSAWAGCTAWAIRASGKRSATFPTTSSGACARTSRRGCCTWCATGCRSSTRATTAASRTSSGCCATPIRPSRTCSRSASAGASPPTSAPPCSSPTWNACSGSCPTASARCCSFSPARRTPPTSRARISSAPSRRCRRRRTSRGGSFSSRATTCTSRGAWWRASTCG